jgi:hypothetical protein
VCEQLAQEYIPLVSYELERLILRGRREGEEGGKERKKEVYRKGGREQGSMTGREEQRKEQGKNGSKKGSYGSCIISLTPCTNLRTKNLQSRYKNNFVNMLHCRLCFSKRYI